MYQVLTIIVVLVSVLELIESTNERLKPPMDTHDWLDFFKNDKHELEKLCSQDEEKKTQELRTVCAEYQDEHFDRRKKRDVVLIPTSKILREREHLAISLNRTKAKRFSQPDYEQRKSIQVVDSDVGVRQIGDVNNRSVLSNVILHDQVVLNQRKSEEIERFARQALSSPCSNMSASGGLGSVGLPPNKSSKLPWIDVVEYICLVFYLVNFILHFCFPPSKRINYVLSMNGVAQIITIVSYIMIFIIFYFDPRLKYHDHDSYHAILKSGRMFVLFELARSFKAIKVLTFSIRHSLYDLIIVGMLLVMACAVFAAFVFSADEEAMESIPNAYWFVIITMTSVGYGDVYPTTLAGRVLTCMVAISGVFFLAITVPIFVYDFGFFYAMYKNEGELKKQTQKHNRVSMVKLLKAQMQSASYSDMPASRILGRTAISK